MAGSLVLGLEAGCGIEQLSHVGSHQKQLFSEGEVQIAKDFEYQASVILEECIQTYSILQSVTWLHNVHAKWALPFLFYSTDVELAFTLIISNSSRKLTLGNARVIQNRLG